MIPQKLGLCNTGITNKEDVDGASHPRLILQIQLLPFQQLTNKLIENPGII